MPDSLYERDALAWSEQQADLLRRLAAGERVNDAVDWPNVIEELQDVGLSELHGCESFLLQALVHLLKLHGWPKARAVAHWRGATVTFLAQAQRRFSPSMRQRISLDKLYRQAVKSIRAESEERARTLPVNCPFSLDELLTDDADMAVLVAKLG